MIDNKFYMFISHCHGTDLWKRCHTFEDSFCLNQISKMHEKTKCNMLKALCLIKCRIQYSSQLDFTYRDFLLIKTINIKHNTTTAKLPNTAPIIQSFGDFSSQPR